MKNNPMQKHETFIFRTLLPAVMDHARRIDVDSGEAALAAFLALGTILLAEDYDADSLLLAIKASAMTTHDVPETQQ